ncbi:MAG TPA: EAL domain-containing protein [Solirubrobacteraceae bacterium]
MTDESRAASALPPTVGVVIAEDDPGMQLALSAVVSAAAGLELQGVAHDADGVIELACRLRPQVCVVDVSMPGGGGARATREIRRCAPWTRIVALSGHQDRSTVLEMLRAGAFAYLVKGASAEEIVEAIHTVARGSRALSPQVTPTVVGELTEKLAREEEAAEARRQEESRLDRVLEEQRFSVVFQPIVQLDGWGVVGAEALARFDDGPPRPPSDWFADAGRLGRLAELEVCTAQAAVLALDRLPRHAFLSINVSPSVIVSPGFGAMLDGVDLRRLVIEITEHAPVEDYDALVPTLDALRARGARLAIDDAGAGFASLRHILRLAPDIIKTDNTLTRNIATSRAERALTAALISFAGEIGAAIVAEGIETRAELEALQALGVRYGQGFHLGRPAPLGSPAPLDPPAARRFHRMAGQTSGGELREIS